MKFLNGENIEKLARYKFCAISVLMTLIPLLVITNGYFPYVLYKAVIIQFLAITAGLIYGFLLVGNWQKYKPNFNWLTVIIFTWLSWLTLTSVFAGQIKLSFFGDWRQAEGLILLWCLFVWLVASVKVLDKKQWLKLVITSVWVSAVVSIFAFLQVKGVDIIFLPATERIASTLGNAGYLATYCLWSVALAIYTYLNSVNKIKYFYLLIALINVITLFLTGTRGAFLGLVGGVVLGFAFLLFNYFKRQKISKKIISRLIISALLIFGLLGLATMFKDSLPGVVQRVFNWSGDLTTVQTRLSIWRSGWQAFVDKPLLGYGYENFYSAFNKKAEVNYYQLAPTETWVSRAHNVFVDNLIYGGAIGLLLFITIWFLAVHGLWRKNTDYKSASILTSALVAYIIQSLFIFDSVATYFVLFFVLAFIISNLNSENDNRSYGVFNIKALLFVPITLIIVLVVGYYQIQTWRVGVNLLNTINWLNKGDAQKANDFYQKIKTYKNRHDIDVALADNLSKVVAQKDINFYKQEDVKNFLSNLILNFEENLVKYNSAEYDFFYQRSLLMAMEVNNNDQLKEKLTNSLLEARNKYPNNPQFLWLQITLAIQLDELDQAEKYANEAISLYPNNNLGYWYKALIEFSKKEDNELGYINALIAIEKGYIVPLDENWQRLYNYFNNKQDWAVVEKLLRMYVQQEPDDRDGYISLSDVIARQGRKDEAKQLLMDLIEVDKGATDDVYVQIQKINQMD